MKKLLNCFLVIFLLSAFVVTFVASSKANAAETHPLIPTCTAAIGAYTTSVTVPTGHETWICTYMSFYDVSRGYLLIKRWVPETVIPNPSSWINVKSGMVMDVVYGSTSQGAQIIQWPSNGQTNQWWQTTYQSSSWAITATNGKSHLCLGVQSASTSWGAAVVQWGCNGSPDQEWLWSYTGNWQNGWPVWNIVNLHSRLCLGISGARTSAAAHVVQWGCNGSPDQEWY